MNQELEKALAYDALSDAERITGESYKENDAVTWLGIGLMQSNNEKKAALLTANRDTVFSGSLEYQIGVIEDMGFRLVASGDIHGTGDKWRIFWRPGVLIFFDSYGSDERMNGGNAYFNYCGPRDAMHRCSNGHVVDLDGVPVWEGHVDVREGLRHCLDSMTEAGRFLEVWLRRPFLWLLSYEDSKKEGYDYNAINAERIAMLPEDVQRAISPANETIP